MQSLSLITNWPKFFFLALLLYTHSLLFAHSPAQAKAIYLTTGHIIGVSDGDTVTALVKGSPIKIRLAGIDCPEKSQSFGKKAKEFTSKLTFDKTVGIIIEGKDRYQRFIAQLILPDGRNLNYLIISQGYAWCYEQYTKDQELYKLAKQAKLSQLGLWADKNAIAPWEYRKLRKNH